MTGMSFPRCSSRRLSLAQAEAISRTGAILLDAVEDTGQQPPSRCACASSSSSSRTDRQMLLGWPVQSWEAQDHSNILYSPMQTDAILANPASVEAEMWRVM